MNEMVESLAMALRERHKKVGINTWAEMSEKNREYWRGEARFVLGHIREPSEAMIEAYTGRNKSTIPGDSSHFTSEARQAMHAFIDVQWSDNQDITDWSPAAEAQSINMDKDQK